jgi:thiol-disulfide isomerase/thioredoxin
LGGSAFGSEAFRGKVLLVDFWATWCHPCTAALPKIESLYEKYHRDGLEIVGVSCDRSASAHAGFFTAHPKITWPQLYSEQTRGWHPLATRLGVIGIPATPVIDRKGIVRKVDRLDRVIAEIPALLREAKE